MKQQQTRMFEFEDLPLFSQTSINTTAPVEPSSATIHTQQALPAKCYACRDTGRVGKNFCWCEAGTKARVTHSD